VIVVISFGFSIPVAVPGISFTTIAKLVVILSGEIEPKRKRSIIFIRCQEGPPSKEFFISTNTPSQEIIHDIIEEKIPLT